jgi:hypothetical protein
MGVTERVALSSHKGDLDLKTNEKRYALLLRYLNNSSEDSSWARGNFTAVIFAELSLNCGVTVAFPKTEALKAWYEVIFANGFEGWNHMVMLKYAQDSFGNADRSLIFEHVSRQLDRNDPGSKGSGVVKPLETKKFD